MAVLSYYFYYHNAKHMFSNKTGKGED